MFSIIIEAIASSLAEVVSTRAIEKGRARHSKLFGWINLFVLLAIIIGCAFLGVYLINEGVWPIAILMFAISAFILYIVTVPVYRKIKLLRKKPE